MATQIVVEAQHVLFPKDSAKPSKFPEVPVLVLGPRRGRQIAILEMGARPRHPRWMSLNLVESLVDSGSLDLRRFTPPERTLVPIEAMSPGQLSNYNERVDAMRALIESPDAELLVYPDEFHRVCATYAKKHGYRRRWICSLASLWLLNGRTESALIASFDRCGRAGHTRSFIDRVGGAKQRDGEAFESIAAAPYSKEDRHELQLKAERIWKSNRTRMTQDELWLRMRQEAKKMGLPPPSFDQVLWLLKDYLHRKRLNSHTGLVHQRYRGIWYASQESELDSTVLQIFTTSGTDSAVTLKNATYYKIVDVYSGYVAAIDVTYDAPSNAILAEVVYLALTGMAGLCRELGLGYSEIDFPPLPPGQSLRVDHQELTSPKMNQALLRHFDWRISFAMVGVGADKGVIEGSIGKDKQILRRRRDSFPKKSVGEVLRQASRHADCNLSQLRAELIRLAHEHNVRELPASKLPHEFLATGKPLNRLEKYKWSLEQNQEIVKPLPTAQSAAMIVLPVDYYSVHAKNGIYIPPALYYSSPELVASGLLQLRSKGDTPQVPIARHRGNVRFVYWARGPKDYVKCHLHASLTDTYGDMTMAEVEAHYDSLPPKAKRERLRLIKRNAAMATPQSKKSQEKSSAVARKASVTKDLARIAAARRLDAENDAKTNADRRFPKDVSSGSKDAQTRNADHKLTFTESQAEAVASLLAQRMKRSSQK